MSASHIAIAATSGRCRTGALRLAMAGAALGAVLALTGTPVLAQSDPVVARVNGYEIHQSELAVAEEELAPSLQNVPPEARRDQLITYLSDMILVARSAEEKGLGSTTDFARKLQFAKTKILMETMLQAEAKTAITDEALHKVYETAVKDMGKEEEVHARHILVATEDEAKAVLADLKKGADFATLAKEKSKDPSGKTNGGDLGYFTKDQMVPEFADVAFKLPKGELSEPVKSQFGWHIIKVEDKRTKPVPTFDQVKPQLEQYVVRQSQASLISKLREGAKIEKVPAPGDKAPAPAAAAPVAPTEKK
jgi:peptidyl-prolyl cis-trans isomerase C